MSSLSSRSVRNTRRHISQVVGEKRSEDLKVVTQSKKNMRRRLLALTPPLFARKRSERVVFPQHVVECSSTFSRGIRTFGGGEGGGTKDDSSKHWKPFARPHHHHRRVLLRSEEDLDQNFRRFRRRRKGGRCRLLRFRRSRLPGRVVL